MCSVGPLMGGRQCKEVHRYIDSSRLYLCPFPYDPYYITVIKHSSEYNYMLSSMSTRESPNGGVILGTPSTESKGRENS